MGNIENEGKNKKLLFYTKTNFFKRAFFKFFLKKIDQRQVLTCYLTMIALWKQKNYY